MRKKIYIIIFFVSVFLLIVYFVSIVPIILASKSKVDFVVHNDNYKNIDEVDMKKYEFYDTLETENEKRIYYKRKNERLIVVYKNGRLKKVNLICDKYIYTFNNKNTDVIDEKSKRILHYKNGKFQNFSIMSTAKYLNKIVYVVTYYNQNGIRIATKIIPQFYNKNNKKQNVIYERYFNCLFAEITKTQFDFYVDNY